MDDGYDLLVVGGGINGAGIARDAAGRGLRVLLVEADDLGSQTSSASTKLIHGGLRYLEHYAFRLVRESLAERERLLATAPHIVWPMRFVLPVPRHGRPAWLLRIGLLLYDRLGGRGRLPRSAAVRLERGVLRDDLRRGFGYSDCWVEDSRLVVLNARDAADHGATVATRTRFVGARRDGDRWQATIADAAGKRTVAARAIANAAGAGVSRVLATIEGAAPERPPRLVKGSHIVVPRQWPGDHAYLFQNDDARVVFAIPYERDFTLIGTTDVPVDADSGPPAISAAETRYLLAAVNAYLAAPLREADIVWSYSGVRPLYDDGAEDASAVTRDYVLRLGFDAGPQLLSIFGGKITTYRRLAEHALDRLAPHLPAMAPAWTAAAPLPGGRFVDYDTLVGSLRTRWPFVPSTLARRLARAYGTDSFAILGDARTLDDLGRDLGGGLHEAELRHLRDREWAQTADDVLWRRSKLGLHTDAAVHAAVAKWMEAHACA